MCRTNAPEPGGADWPLLLRRTPRRTASPLTSWKLGQTARALEDNAAGEMLIGWRAKAVKLEPEAPGFHISL